MGDAYRKRGGYKHGVLLGPLRWRGCNKDAGEVSLCLRRIRPRLRAEEAACREGNQKPLCEMFSIAVGAAAVYWSGLQCCVLHSSVFHVIILLFLYS